MKPLHDTQLAILNKLLFSPSLRYSEIKPDKKMDNNKFDFHLDKMIEIGYVLKIEEGYTLTASGKEYANRLDTDEVQIERQAKIGVAIKCRRNYKGRTQYLMQQRLKQPYYGYYGVITGKIRQGETVIETAHRELEEETGLKAELKVAQIYHKMDYSKEGEILEDKYFFSVIGEEPQGDLLETFEGGKNIWLTMDEINKLPKLFPDVIVGLKIFDNSELTFVERKFYVEEF